MCLLLRVMVGVHLGTRDIGLHLLLFGLPPGLVVLIGAVPVRGLVRRGRALTVTAVSSFCISLLSQESTSKEQNVTTGSQLEVAIRQRPAVTLMSQVGSVTDPFG